MSQQKTDISEVITELHSFLSETSYFDDVSKQTPSAKRTLDACIKLIKNGNFKGLQEQIRAIKVKKEQQEKKRSLLPCFTPSLTLSTRASNTPLKDREITYTGFIGLDIDKLSSDQLKSLKTKLKKDKYVCAFWESVSGNGLFVLMKVEKAPLNKTISKDGGKEAFKGVYRMASDYFHEKYKIEPDQNCSDPTRTRFFSSDQSLYLNENSSIFYHHESKEERKKADRVYKVMPNSNVAEDVKFILDQIEEQKISIAKDYNDWTRVCFSLIREFGEFAEEPFRILSEQWEQGQDDDQTIEDKFKVLLKAYDPERSKPNSISSFFYLAKQAGLNLPRTTKPIEEPKIEWGEMQPITQDLPPVKKLTEDMIPQKIRDFCIDQAELKPVPVCYIVSSVLVLAGSLIGNKVLVEPKSKDVTWTEAANIWGGIVGDPSTMKSPSISSAMSLLKPLISEAQKKFQEEMEGFKEEERYTKTRIKILTKKYEKAVGDGKKDEAKNTMDEIKKEEMPAPPTPTTYKTNDVTPEGLAQLCQFNTNGILIEQDELIGLFRSFNKKGYERLKDILLSGWNGTGSYTSNRKNTTLDLHIPELSISIVGGIQPDKLEPYLNSAFNGGDNDGFFQRFSMLFYPDNIQGKLVDREANLKAIERTREVFFKLGWNQWEEKIEQRSAINDKLILKFDPEGQKAWNELYNEILVLASADAEPIVKQHYTKFKKLSCVLPMIFHLIEHVDSKKIPPITKKQVELAKRWIDVLKTHAERIYDGLGNPKEGATRWLVEKIQKKSVKGSTTVRSLARTTRKFDEDQITHALEVLIQKGWIKPVERKSGQGGRPTTDYMIHPNL